MYIHKYIHTYIHRYIRAQQVAEALLAGRKMEPETKELVSISCSDSDIVGYTALSPTIHTYMQTYINPYILTYKCMHTIGSRSAPRRSESRARDQGIGVNFLQ